MLKSDKIEITIWIVCITLLALVFLTFDYADALTRDERNNIKDRINTAETAKEDLDIQEKRDLILEAEQELEVKKRELKSLKNDTGSSWEAVLLLDEAEREITIADNLLTAARKALIDILNLESDFILLIKELVAELDRDETTPATPTNSTGTYSLTKKLGINLSKTCLIMIQNNFTSPCPSYRDLLILDNSIYKFSGNFTTDENGFFHRVDPVIDNSWRLYDFDDTPRMFVDPPSGMSSRVKLITIHPNFDTYMIRGDNVQLQQYKIIDVEITKYLGNLSKTEIIQVRNQTQEAARIIYHDRYVENCNSAVIDAADWKLILADTINYLRNNCNEAFTEFDPREVIIDIKTEIDITTSPNWQHKQWLDRMKETCKVLC